MSKRVEQLNQKRFVRTKNWTPSGIKPTTLKNTHGMVCLKFKLKFYLLYSQESIAVRGSTTSKVRVKQGNFGSNKQQWKYMAWNEIWQCKLTAKMKWMLFLWKFVGINSLKNWQKVYYHGFISSITDLNSNKRFGK